MERGQRGLEKGREKKNGCSFFFLPSFRHQVSAPSLTTSTSLSLSPLSPASSPPPRYQVKKCEKPHHEVLRTLGSATRSWYDRAPAVEVRRTSPLVVAEVEVPRSKGSGEEDAMRDALSRGFRQIASYIFGRNMAEEGEAAAAETDPRFLDGSAMGGGGGEKVSFSSSFPSSTSPPPALPPL